MSFTLHSLFVTTGLLALAAGAASEKPQVSSKKRGYEAFPMVKMRNVFDPERQPGVVVAASDPSQAQAQAPAASDYAALTGTMITADKTLAFFSGSRPEFSKVLAISGTIAGAILTKITSSGIEVERDGKRITIAVGQTVPLDGASAPALAPAPAPNLSTAPSAEATPATSSSPAIAPDREALKRRMMEKRQQELK